MDEYIKREAALMKLMQDGCSAKNLQSISDMPAADVVPVVHGRWVTHYRSGTTVAEGYVSTCCDMWNNRKSPYCPNCGAKMDGGDSDAAD